MAASDIATTFTDVNITGALYVDGTALINDSGSIVGSVDLNVSAVTTGIGLAADDANALTTGQAVKIASSATAITTTGRLLLSDHTGNAGVSAVLNEFKSAAADETTIVKVTASAALAAGVALDLSAAALTTGKVVDISDLDAITTGKAIHVDATGVTQTSGILVHLDSASTGITGAGRIFLSDHTGNAGVSAILNEFASAAADETVICKVTASAALAAGVALQVSGAAMTTGTAIAAADLNALTTGIGVHVASSATAITGAGRLVYSNHSGATGTSAILNEFASAANDETTIVKITASAALAAGVALDISAAALTTGKLVDMSDLDAITTGKAIHVDATGITQTDGILVHIDSASTALTATGRLLLVDHTGNAGVSNINSEFKSAAADETVIVQILASAALAAGKALNISAAAMTTGIGISMPNLDALTTGNAVNIVSNSADATARSLVYVKNDHASATAAICLELVNDAPLAPIKTTAAATSTNYFKVGAFNGVTLWVGNGNTANAVLSGTAGDILFNGGSNKPEYCTGTTNWTALV